MKIRYVHHPRGVQAAGVSALRRNLDSAAVIVNPNPAVTNRTASGARPEAGDECRGYR